MTNTNMPVINPNLNKTSTGSTYQQRSNFKPPWVKDGPSPLPMPSAPWAPKPNTSNAQLTGSEPEKPTLRKQTQIMVPIEPNNNQNVTSTINRSQEKVIPIRIESSKPAPKVPTSINESVTQPSWRKDRRMSPQPVSKPPIPSPAEKKMPPVAPKPPPPPPTVAKKPPPPPPPMVPPAPPMMDGSKSSAPFERKPLTEEKAAKLEVLRSRPRRRPDWTDMMKEVESGRKLKHVQCNDRSAPVIPQMKAKGQFVYESEKKEGDDGHNKLLKEIQGGIKLKKVKTNDRSKPNLDGLRKFRREMTIEEQLQKSMSMADVVAAAVQPDELDDIDKVREDLQSAKQMLALELRSKEAIERENKRLLARLTNLEAELEKEKTLHKTADTRKVYPVRTDDDEKLIDRLKEAAADSERTAKDMEHKYHTTAEQLDNMRRKLESAWLRNQELEQQLKTVSQGTPLNQLMRQPSKKFVPIANAGGSVDLISDDEEDEETESESEEESETESVVNQEKQIARELRLLTTKLKTFREKQAASMKERRILRENLKKAQNELKEEKKKYKVLQKEVDKMAKLMREHEEDESDDDDEDAYQEEEDEETETESESEESEEDEKSDEELPPHAGIEEKRKFLLERTKRHENRLASLKKGNNLMKANIERLIDDVSNQREKSLTLQEDLNNILSDLG